MIDLSELVSSFRRCCAKRPRLFRAPGRVNLIGEHTDYNGGYVLPMAIDRGTFVAIAGRTDRLLRVRSLNFDDSVELDLDELGNGRRGTWRDYVEGVASALAHRGAPLTGADIALASDLSIGGGLSSSAALEVALAIALVAISGSRLDKLDIAFAGQTAEHRHVGIQCGIMDQFTSVHALKGHAILLDCRSLQARHIPLRLGEHCIVICDSKIRHTLAASEYNRRRQDCESGVKLLCEVIPGIRALRDVTPLELQTNGTALPERVLRRCRHVINENERTLKAADALAGCRLNDMGKLMSESHRSLRDDYEVSCPELDLLVECALAQPGVLGARMTGGGFGGCSVNLVERLRVPAFIEKVSLDYQAETGITPDIFVAEASQGAGEIISRGQTR